MNLSQLHHQGRIHDPSTAGVATNFGQNLYPGLNNPGMHANWQTNPSIRVPMSGSDNTALRRALVRVIATGARETITISPDNPWIGRLAPAVRTDELVIKKDFLDIVRGIAPYAPHYGTTRKQRVRQMTRRKTQTRKTWGMTIEKTMLFSEQGNNLLQALIRGVRENVAGTLIYEAQQEFLQAGEEYRQENFKFGNNPYQNIHGMQGVAQDNAMLNFYQIRRDMYGALSKSGDQFRAVLDRVIEMLKRRNAQPDVMIVGPGIKARLTLGDKENTQYYIAGDAGTFLRVNGSSSIDTYMGLSIVETLPVNPDEEIRSTYQREVEVGEFALLTRGENSSGLDFRPFHRSKKIYDETSDSMKTIKLSQVVAHAPDFDADGSLSYHHQQLAEEYNSNALSYRRIHGLTNSTKIHPSRLSLFIYQDDNNMARVANVWGQVEGLGGVDGIRRFAQSILATSGMAIDRVSNVSQALQDGAAYLEEIKSRTVTNGSFTSTLYTGAQMARTLRGENNQIIDAQGNQFGSLTPAGGIPTGAALGNFAGHANGAGMLTLASAGDDRATEFVNAVKAIVPYLRTILPLDPKSVTQAWHHKPTAVTAFIDIMAGAQLPVWLPANGVNDSASDVNAAAATATVQIPDFTGTVTGTNNAAAQTAANGLSLAEIRRLVGGATLADTSAGRARSLRAVQTRLLDVVRTGSEVEVAEAIDILQEIVGKIGLGRSGLSGLAAVSYRAALIFQEKQVDQIDGFYDLISHMLSVDDISPASYIAVDAKTAKKSIERLVRIAAHIAEMNAGQASAYIQEGIDARAGGDSVLTKWYKKTPKISDARDVLDAHNYTQTGITPVASAGDLVRTPLTVSRSQLQTILTANGGAGFANFKVSNPARPWTYVAAAADLVGTDSNAFRVGGAGIGGQLEMHEQTFFANLLEKDGDGSSVQSMVRGKRSRGFDSDDDEDDYGYTSYRPSQVRNAREFSLQPSSSSDVRGMDLGEASSSSSFASSSSMSVGARYPGSRATRTEYGLEPLVAGRKYQEMASSVFARNYDAVMSLSGVEQVLGLMLLFTPINKKTAMQFATDTDAPFGGFIARPHIRHLMSSAQVVESGPSTALTHYTETDITSVATNTKEWIFNLTWQSTPFVHAPQFTELFHDACAQGYYGGNDITFMKAYSDYHGPSKVYDPETGAQASIYAFLIGAHDKLPNPTSLTGVHHVSGYDNNQSSLPVPHYRGAPLAEKVWGFSQLQKQQVRTGFVDSLANTLVFQGLQYGHTGSQISNDFVTEYENTGHWGKVEPNAGLSYIRKGSALLQQA